MMEIKRLDGTTVLTLENIPEGALVHRELMSDHYVKIPFTLEEPVYFQLGDYVVLDGFGRFELTEPYAPKYNLETAGYDYTLQLDAYYIKWKNKKVRYIPQSDASETSFHLTATAEVHLGVIIAGINAIGAKDSNFLYDGTTEFGFALRNFPSELSGVAKYKQYNNTDFISALNDLASIFECEWWVEDNTINFGRCSIDGTEVELELGENVEEMSSTESKDDYATRIIAFGSDRNLPSSYREDASADVTVNGVVQKRLMLPLTGDHACPYGYVQDEGVTDETKAIEGIVIFEDIYPRTNCVVGSVEEYTDTATDEETGETVSQTFYRLHDSSGLAFSSGYILEGETLHIRFTSGSMNGMDFECQYNDDEEYYEVVVNEDYGRALPDESLHPEVGDTFVLYGWDASKIEDLGLIDAAEEELYQAALKKLESMKVDPNTYTCKMRSDWYSEQVDDNNLATYSMGQPVKLINPTYFENGRSSRIIGYEIKLDIPYDTPEFIVGESTAYSRSEDLQSQIDSITYNGVSYASSGSGSGGGSIYIITTTSSATPSDYNVFSAARTVKQFLRRDKEDSAAGKITFKSGLSSESDVDVSGNLEVGKDVTVDGGLDVGGDGMFGGKVGSKSFATGLLGNGWRIQTGGHGELDSLTLRKFLEVPELRFNRITVRTGVQWQTFGAGLIEEVTELTETTGIIKLKLEEGEYGAVAVSDYCMGIFHNETNASDNETENADSHNGNFTFAGFMTIYFKVLAICDANGDVSNPDSKNQYFLYQLRETETDGWTKQFHPQPSMSFACYANPDNSERQACEYSTTEYRIMLTGMVDWTYDGDNITLILGNLNNFTIPAKKLVDGEWVEYDKELEGYGIAFGRGYMWGSIEQFSRQAVLVTQQIYQVALNVAPETVLSNENWLTDYEWSSQPQQPSPSAPYLYSYWLQTYDDGSTTTQGPVLSGYDNSLFSLALNKEVVSVALSNWYDEGEDTDVLEFDVVATLLLGNSPCDITAAEASSDISGFSYTVEISGSEATFHITISGYVSQQVAGLLAENAYIMFRCYGNSINYAEHSLAVIENRQGKDGNDGKSLTTVNNYYAWTSSGSTAPDTWGEANKIPSHTSGSDYLWNYEECLDDNGNVISTSDPTCIGFFANDGVGIDSIEEYFVLGTSTAPDAPTLSADKTSYDLGTAGWSKTSYEPTKELPYLWNVEIVKFSDETYHIGTVHTAAVRGDDGTNGTSITIKGRVATSSDLPDPSGYGEGDAMICTDTGHIWVIVDGVWQDCGQFKGEDGTSQYIHIKYSDDGGTTFTAATDASDDSTIGETEGTYMGFYVDSNEADSTNVADYSWHKISAEDGPGQEYVFCRQSDWIEEGGGSATPSITDASSESGYQQDEYIPSGPNGETWTDEPSGVGSEYRYEFYAQRKKVGGVWQPFGSVKLWSRYAEDGETTVFYQLVLSTDYVSVSTEDDVSTYTPSTVNVKIVMSSGASNTNVATSSSLVLTYTKDGAAAQSLTISNATEGVSIDVTDVTSYITFILSNGSNVIATKSCNIVSEAAQGIQGVGIASIVEYYALSTSGTTAPTSWSNTLSQPTKAKPYLWNYEESIGTDGNVKGKTDPAVIAIYTEDGRGITSIVEYYQISASSTTPPDRWSGDTPTSWVKTDTANTVDSSWSTNAPNTTLKKPYLWNFAVVTYSKSSVYEYEPPQCVGVHGDSPLIADLDNEMDCLALTNAGALSSAESFATNGKMYYGSTEQVITGVEFSSSDSNVTGSYTLSSDGKTAACTITAAAATYTDNVEVTISFTCALGTVSKVFTLGLAKAGSNGTSPTIYQLLPSVSAVKVDKDGGYNPSTLTVSVLKKTGSSTSTQAVTSSTSGLYLYYSLDDGTTWTRIYTTSSLDLASLAPTKNIRLRLIASASTSDSYSGTIYDKETVPVVIDGTDSTGLKGDIDNEMTGFVLPSDGEFPAYGGYVSTNFSIQYGTELKEITSYEVTNPDDERITILKSLSSDSKHLTVKVYPVEGEDFNDLPTFDFVITGACALGTVSQTFTVVFYKSGTNGEDAVMYEIVPSSSTIKKTSTGYANALHVQVKKIVGKTSSFATTGFYCYYSVDNGSWTRLTSFGDSGTDLTSLAPMDNIRLRIQSAVSTAEYSSDGTISGVTLYDRETIPVVSDGTDGDDAVNYTLEPSKLFFRHTESSTYDVRCYKLAGETKEICSLYIFGIDCDINGNILNFTGNATQSASSYLDQQPYNSSVVYIKWYGFLTEYDARSYLDHLEDPTTYPSYDAEPSCTCTLSLMEPVVDFRLSQEGTITYPMSADRIPEETSISLIATMYFDNVQATITNLTISNIQGGSTSGMGQAGYSYEDDGSVWMDFEPIDAEVVNAFQVYRITAKATYGGKEYTCYKDISFAAVTAGTSVQGPQGLQGCVIRLRGEWNESTKYVNESSDTKTTVRYIDIVQYTPSGGTTKWYQRNTYTEDYGTTATDGTVTYQAPTDSTYWTEASSFEFIATKLLLSDEAWISYLTGKSVYVVDGNGDVIAGIQSVTDDSTPQIFAGANANGATTAPFRVYPSGAVVCDNLTAKGTVTAKVTNEDGDESSAALKVGSNGYAGLWLENYYLEDGTKQLCSQLEIANGARMSYIYCTGDTLDSTSAMDVMGTSQFYLSPQAFMSSFAYTGDYSLYQYAMYIGAAYAGMFISNVVPTDYLGNHAYLANGNDLKTLYENSSKSDKAYIHITPSELIMTSNSGTIKLSASGFAADTTLDTIKNTGYVMAYTKNGTKIYLKFVGGIMVGAQYDEPGTDEMLLN